MARVLLEPTADAAGVSTLIEVGADLAGATSVSSVFTLCNSAIGAGVLSLPYAFRCAGLLGCLGLCVVLAACEGFTLYVLAKMAERYCATSYGQLVRRALGRKLSASLSAILLVYLYGSCVAYMVIIADTFTALGEQRFGADSWAASRPLVLGVASAAIVVMCFPRNLSALESVSVAAVVGFSYTSIALLVEGGKIVAARPEGQRLEGVKLFDWTPRALYAVPIIVFGFNSHPNVVSVFAELEQFPAILARLPDSPGRFSALHALAPKPTTTKLIGMLSVIISAYAVISTGYMAVGIAGYLAFPTSVDSNVLNTFPDFAPITVARAVIGLVVVGHFPINHHPARASTEDLLDALFGTGPLPRWASTLFTFVFVGGTMATALVVADLGSVLHMVGGTAAAYMIFALPGLLLLDAAIIKHTAASPTPSETAEEPLLVDRKAGLREAGLIYSPRKSWWAGAFLLALAVVVLSITLGTALLG